jgi:putative tryptophan/tyrosine transport system substrate-binding protein
MKRREFIAGLGGAVAWPLTARTQQTAQTAVPVVGLLQGRSPETASEFDRLPELAADLVSRRVNVIAAGYPAGEAAKAATSMIPIVFMGGSDPVRTGLVTSINRPGGNVTGVSLVASDLESKRIGILRELVPRATVLGAMIYTTDLSADFELQEVKEAGRRLGISVEPVKVDSERDFDEAFATLARKRADAIIVMAATYFNIYRDRLVALAARYSIPTAYELREFAEAGGLMTYGPSIKDAFRQGGVYSGRVLKGEKPADLPVLLPAKFELVINLTTAKALGLDVPETLLATADELIK